MRDVRSPDCHFLSVNAEWLNISQFSVVLLWTVVHRGGGQCMAGDRLADHRGRYCDPSGNPGYTVCMR